MRDYWKNKIMRTIPITIRFKKGFTLVELLVTVAIITILATIAIPNYLAANIKTRISQTRKDMQSISTALESYSVDYNTYPFMRGNVLNGPQLNRPEDVNGYGQNCFRAFRTVPIELTTPISYITNSGLKDDPFKTPGYDSKLNQSFNTANHLDKGYGYDNIQEFIDSPGNGFDNRDMVAYGYWRLYSLGPEKLVINTLGRTIYDPTNGLVSNGQIIRTQRSPAGERTEDTSTGNN